jgi:hypothetical protein
VFETQLSVTNETNVEPQQIHMSCNRNRLRSREPPWNGCAAHIYYMLGLLIAILLFCSSMVAIVLGALDISNCSSYQRTGIWLVAVGGIIIIGSTSVTFLVRVRPLTVH